MLSDVFRPALFHQQALIGVPIVASHSSNFSKKMSDEEKFRETSHLSGGRV
jgi:hypothetical protein